MRTSPTIGLVGALFLVVSCSSTSADRGDGGGAGATGAAGSSGAGGQAGSSGAGGQAGRGNGGAGGSPIDAAADGPEGCGPGFAAGSSRPAGDGCNSCACLGNGTVVCSTAQCAAPDASLGDTSPGTVSLRLVVSSGGSFCAQSGGCDPPTHITIRTTAGQTIATTTPFCSAICSDACQPPACPGFACLPQAIAFTGTEVPWDGAFYEPSTCGAGSTCYRQHYVPAGRYVAHMCANPGSVQAIDGGPPACTGVSAAVCVDVPFDLPGPSPVVGTL